MVTSLSSKYVAANEWWALAVLLVNDNITTAPMIERNTLHFICAPPVITDAYLL